MKSSGFTLMETLVALAILGIGASAFALFLGMYWRDRGAEIAYAKSAQAAFAYVESAVRSAPDCGGPPRSSPSFPPRSSPSFPLRSPAPLPSQFEILWDSVPGAAGFVWLQVRFGESSFRRLVRCRNSQENP